MRSSKMVLFLVGGLMVGCEIGAGDPEDTDEINIVGGVESNVDGVVAIFSHLPGETTGGLCSGTIVSDTVVLTAAHCVHPAFVPAGSVFEVFTGPSLQQPTSRLAVAGTAYAAGFDPNNLPGGHDVAVVILAEPTAIAPRPVNFDPAAPTIGADVRQIGYGVNDPDADTGAGVQREVTTPLTDVNDLLLLFGDETRSQCHGDSGGPSLLAINGVETIIGVSSFGPAIAGFPDCHLGSFDARTDSDAAFIQQYIGADGGDGEDGDGEDGEDGEDGGGGGESTCTISGSTNGVSYEATCTGDAGGATQTCTCTVNGATVDVCQSPRGDCSVSVSDGQVEMACCDF